jgi:peptide/nickel transport system permease protein
MTDEDRSESIPPDALDLSRRKVTRQAEVVRESIYGARRAAAPYATMARIAVAQLARNRLARLGALVLGVLVLVAAAADFLASDLPVACRWRGSVYFFPNVHPPAALAGHAWDDLQRGRQSGDWLIPPLVAHGPATRSEDVLLPPLERRHPLGTDAFGRDVFSRIVHGARTALGVGVAGATVLVAIGVLFGALAGLRGGVVDAVVARLVESLTAIPTLLLVLVVNGLVARATTYTLVWTVALTRWPELARLVRAEVLWVMGNDYVTAARALGASQGRVLRRYVLPNAIGPAIVAAAFGVASIVLAEAAVSFLGVGPNSTASWGEAFGEARANPQAWWLVVFPGAALLATLAALNLLGEAARDALDPRLRQIGPDRSLGSP